MLKKKICIITILSNVKPFIINMRGGQWDMTVEAEDEDDNGDDTVIFFFSIYIFDISLCLPMWLDDAFIGKIFSLRNIHVLCESAHDKNNSSKKYIDV